MTQMHDMSLDEMRQLLFDLVKLVEGFRKLTNLDEITKRFSPDQVVNLMSFVQDFKQYCIANGLPLRLTFRPMPDITGNEIWVFFENNPITIEDIEELMEIIESLITTEEKISVSVLHGADMSLRSAEFTTRKSFKYEVHLIWDPKQQSFMVMMVPIGPEEN